MLYEDRIKEKISEAVFSSMILQYEAEYQRISKQMQAEEANRPSKPKPNIRDIATQELKAIEYIAAIPPALLKKLIQRIDVHQRNFDRNTHIAKYEIDIKYTFAARKFEIQTP